MKNYQNRVIMHMDGDAFFASVEQAKDWRLRGKPVITGGERFIAASMSYEAKARGVTRAMRLDEIRRICPDAVILPSDYITYGIFARRMYNIVRRYTPHVEEYSIDECFADITGLDELMGISYEDIGKKIKAELERKLGITFGVGVASTKVLAKVASKHRKPAGFTYIPADIDDERADVRSNSDVTSEFDRSDDAGNYNASADGTSVDSARLSAARISSARISFLKNTPIEKVWGVGTSTTKHLRAHGIMSALDFASLSSAQLAALSIAKPYRQIHAELNGLSVLEVNSGPREMPKSVMCTRTFTPPSRDLEVIFSHLSKNIEEACERLRHDGAEAKSCSFFFKSQEFRYYGAEHAFEHPTDDSIEVIAAARRLIGAMYKGHLEYRATGVSLRGLVPAGLVPHRGLFDPVDKSESGTVREIANDSLGSANVDDKKVGNILYKSIDKINRKYGEHSIMLGSSMRAVGLYHEKRKRKNMARNKANKVWEIPFLGVVR